MTPGQLTDIERQFVQDGIADGIEPAGDPVVGYLRGQVVVVIRPTAGRSLCWGESGLLGRQRGCCTHWTFPTEAAPHLQVTWGPGHTGYEFLTVLLADHQEVRSPTCGGVRAEPRRVGEISASGTGLTAYAHVTPWWPDGAVQAQVLRDDGLATEQVALGGLGAPRDWFRACGSRPLDHP